MAPGSLNDQDLPVKDDILYGATPTRGADIDPYAEIAEDGVIEHHDQRYRLVMLEIPEGGERTMDGAELHGPCTAYICDGQLHRDDGPALINENGQYWLCHGKQHREDGPAIINDDGEAWLQDGELHREADADGIVGPALTVNGAKWWYRHGQAHREDGPAVLSAGGSHEEYWLEGKKYFDHDAYLAAVAALQKP